MNWKKFALLLLYPHVSIIICLLPISIAFLVFSLVYLSPSSILAIISYLISFYVLFIIVLRLPKLIAFFKKLKSQNKYLKRFFSDVHLRINLSLYSSLVWNVVFAIFQLWLGFYHNSLWFYSMFAYYIMLGGIRFLLVRHTTKYNINDQMELERKKCFECGWLLLILNIALAVIVFFVVYLNKTFYHHMITTIALAMFVFISLTFSIINSIRYKKYKSPIYSTVKKINLISNCVSMLTLEATMLTTFGSDSSPLFRQIILSLTGLAVVTIAISIAINMICRHKKHK